MLAQEPPSALAQIVLLGNEESPRPLESGASFQRNGNGMLALLLTLLSGGIPPPCQDERSGNGNWTLALPLLLDMSCASK